MTSSRTWSAAASTSPCRTARPTPTWCAPRGRPSPGVLGLHGRHRPAPADRGDGRPASRAAATPSWCRTCSSGPARAPVVPDVVDRLQGEARDAGVRRAAPDDGRADAGGRGAGHPGVRRLLWPRGGRRRVVAGHHRLLHGRGAALRAAAQLPDRVVAAASFHGGNLAPDDATGPHRGAAAGPGRGLRRARRRGPSMPPEQVARLERGADRGRGRRSPPRSTPVRTTASR